MKNNPPCHTCGKPPALHLYATCLECDRKTHERVAQILLKSRGGARKGAGRKPTGPTRAKMSVTVSHEAAANIRRAAKREGASVSSIADKLFMGEL